MTNLELIIIWENDARKLLAFYYLFSFDDLELNLNVITEFLFILNFPSFVQRNLKKTFVKISEHYGA